MGWLFMQSLKGHATPKAYLDAQFTFEGPQGASRVLASALVGFRTYYAAVEQVLVAGDRSVYALICLVRYNPRDKEGYIFGYKDMDEGMGPVESACPASVLDLLTQTDQKYALAWRARCRVRLAERRDTAKTSLPRPGETVVFSAPIRFRDGRSFTRLIAVRLAGRRGLVFRGDTGGLYRIPNLKSLEFVVEGPPETATLPFG